MSAVVYRIQIPKPDPLFPKPFNYYVVNIDEVSRLMSGVRGASSLHTALEYLKPGQGIVERRGNQWHFVRQYMSNYPTACYRA
jgi:hypothetical protein